MKLKQSQPYKESEGSVMEKVNVGPCDNKSSARFLDDSWENSKLFSHQWGIKPSSALRDYRTLTLTLTLTRNVRKTHHRSYSYSMYFVCSVLLYLRR